MPNDAAKAKAAAGSLQRVAELLETADQAPVVMRVGALNLVGRKSEAQRLRRRAWTSATTRQEQIDLTLRAAAQDSRFRQLVGEADRARDERRWAAAEKLYAQALQRYPLHGGYRVQLGHMLKEQDRLKAAEIQYRSALALGAPPVDVEEHLDFVSRVQDYHGPRPATAPKDGRPMDAPPSEHDIHTLAYLIWRQERAPEDQVLDLLRRCDTCETAAVAMTQDRRFTAGNRPFMEILRSLR